MIIQIYEIQTASEAELCIGLGVDHVGSVILSADDWRRPELLEVVKTCKGLGAKSSMIPLFGGADLLSRVIDYYQPHFIHFCESLTDSKGVPLDISLLVERDALLRRRHPDLKIIRSIPVPVHHSGDGFPTLELAQALEGVSDVFLIDTWLGKEPVEGFIGITGVRADIGVACRLVRQSRLPVILAGGLSPENVFSAITAVRPWGVDSCTLTNRTDQQGRPIRFCKDPEKLKRFIGEASRAFSLCNSQA
jgi:phosphoribosylanthranilate isomerase